MKEQFYRWFPALTAEVLLKRSELDQYLGDVAGLSLVMPNTWVPEWQSRKPWLRASETIVLGEER